MSVCRVCNSEAAVGSRWCPICHANLLSPQSGRLASPGKRLGGYFLDIAIPFFAFVTIGGIAGASAATGSDAGVSFGVLLAVVLCVGYAIWALMLFSRGTTPGKKMLGMRVVKEGGAAAGFGTMLVREWIGKLISALILSLGFLWILLDKDRQGWHDKLVSTYVVEDMGTPSVTI